MSPYGILLTSIIVSGKIGCILVIAYFTWLAALFARLYTKWFFEAEHGGTLDISNFVLGVPTLLMGYGVVVLGAWGIFLIRDVSRIRRMYSRIFRAGSKTAPTKTDAAFVGLAAASAVFFVVFVVQPFSCGYENIHLCLGIGWLAVMSLPALCLAWIWKKRSRMHVQGDPGRQLSRADEWMIVILFLMTGTALLTSEISTVLSHLV